MPIDQPVRISFMMHTNPTQDKGPPPIRVALGTQLFTREQIHKLHDDVYWDEVKQQLRLQFNQFAELFRLEVLRTTNIQTEGLPLPDSGMLRGLANLIDAGKRIVAHTAACTDEVGNTVLTVVLRNPTSVA